MGKQDPHNKCFILLSLSENPGRSDLVSLVFSWGGLIRWLSDLFRKTNLEQENQMCTGSTPIISFLKFP